ncbi:MAG TPA: cupin domain-containing protein [Thermoanaerobaculia bacterium]|nr:cupin domain-containing protein [Thermoanaerobaculia bacterium]
MHPSEETLLALASGEADLPLRATVEGHLASCPSCRTTLGELTAAGGALLRGLAPAPPPDHLWQQVLARVTPGKPPAASALDPLAALPLPEETRRELPPLCSLRWRSAWTPKARYALLARERATGSLLLVGHMPPGRYFPRHQHPGREDVLVLAGGYEDERGRYEAGEYAVYEPGSQHRPATEPGEECWILFRLEAPIRFLGWRGGLQRLLASLP